MSIPRPATAACGLIVFAALTLTVAAGTARAQQQESELERRIKHPNMDLHFEGFEKSFDTKAAGHDKQAFVRPFGFGGRSVNVKGDGTFHAKAFNDGRGGFPAGSFAGVKPATAVDRQAMPGSDRLFATRSVDVREDRAASKPAAVHQFVNADKPFLVPGKRQDIIDDLRQQKNLSVDQIREILNKSR